MNRLVHVTRKWDMVNIFFFSFASEPIYFQQIICKLKVYVGICKFIRELNTLELNALLHHLSLSDWKNGRMYAIACKDLGTYASVYVKNTFISVWNLLPVFSHCWNSSRYGKFLGWDLKMSYFQLNRIWCNLW